MNEDIADKQNRGIRITVLILTTIIFIMGFYFLFKGNDLWITLHIAGLIGLMYSYILRRCVKPKEKAQ